MSRTPWFPGQFGDDDAGRDREDAEPYAPASLHGAVTNPYGDVPATGSSGEEAGTWTPQAAEPVTRATDDATHYAGFYDPGTFTDPYEVRAEPLGPEADDIPMRTGRADAFPPPSQEEAHRRERRRSRIRYGLYAGATVAIAFAVVLGLGSVLEESPGEGPRPRPEEEASPPPTLAPQPEPTAVEPFPDETAVGERAATGAIEVEVLAVATGIDELGEGATTVAAEGEFIVVRLEVTATEPVTFLDIDQSLIDAEGTEHEPAREAPAVVPGNRLLLADLDAGESAEGVVVFDVEPGTVPQTFVVRASETDDGEAVPLP